MSLSDTADHTLHPRHNGVCPPCPAERAEALDVLTSLEAALAAFDAAAVALTEAARDADVLETFAGHHVPPNSAPEVIVGWLQTIRDVSELIDGQKLSALRKLAERG